VQRTSGKSLDDEAEEGLDWVERNVH